MGLVPEKGTELVLNPTAAERNQIAAWLAIESLESFRASVTLTRAALGRYLYRGHFDADVVQACVVTLEPVPSHLSGDFERAYEVVAPVPSKRRHVRQRSIKEGDKAEPPPPVIALPDLDADAPETIDSPVVDVAAPVLEELSLALDPYPRKPGVSYVPPEEDASAAKDNPFAVLKNLKSR